jgi:hypothetical protein
VIASAQELPNVNCHEKFREAREAGVRRRKDEWCGAPAFKPVAGTFKYTEGENATSRNDALAPARLPSHKQRREAATCVTASRCLAFARARSSMIVRTVIRFLA